MTAKASNVSQDIGDVSRRWNLQSWYDHKSNAFVDAKHKHAGASDETEDEVIDWVENLNDVSFEIV